MSIPLSPVWTISCQGVTVSAAAAGITGMTRHRAGQTEDRCVLQCDGRAFDAAPPFPFGASVVIQRGGTTWFVGRVVTVPSSGDARAESQGCELSGPWWYLAHLVYQQSWTIRGGAATATLSRVVLGQASDGSTLNTGQVITAALQYAIDAGAPLAIGTIEPAFDAPLDEVRDLTCAEVIQRALRWTPDCVAWFDYATAPVPTFHCRARGSLPAATLTVGVPPLAAVQELTPRYDLQVPAVVFHYEMARQVGGEAQTDVADDVAPAGATGREFGAVVSTIPLRGEASMMLSQRIVTQPVAVDTATAGADVVAQLIGRDAALAMYAADPAITPAGIAITSLAQSVVGGSGRSRDTVDGGPLGNALIEGEITDWMIENCGVQTQKQRLAFTYTLDRGSEGAPDVSAPQTGSVEFTATNAASGSYTTMSSYRPDDARPTVGRAAAYLAAWAALQYSGRVVLVEAEAGGTAAGLAGSAAGLGGVINVAGGAVAAWATMRAAVVAEVVNVADGTTTLTLGPLPEEGSSVAGLAAALQTTRAGVSGREGGSPAALGTASSATRATGVRG